MAKVVIEQEYLVTEGFDALVEISAEEFNTRQSTPNVTSREFKVSRDCTVIRNGMTVPLLEGQKLTDVGLAFEAVRQGASVSIREQQAYDKGQLIFDEDLGEALLAQGQSIVKQPKGSAEKAEAEAAKAAEEAAKREADKAARAAVKAEAEVKK